MPPNPLKEAELHQRVAVKTLSPSASPLKQLKNQIYLNPKKHLIEDFHRNNATTYERVIGNRDLFKIIKTAKLDKKSGRNKVHVPIEYQMGPINKTNGGFLNIQENNGDLQVINLASNQRSISDLLNKSSSPSAPHQSAIRETTDNNLSGTKHLREN